MFTSKQINKTSEKLWQTTGGTISGVFHDAKIPGNYRFIIRLDNVSKVAGSCFA